MILIMIMKNLAMIVKQTNKSEESVTSTIMPGEAMENVKCKIID